MLKTRKAKDLRNEKNKRTSEEHQKKKKKTGKQE